jgi:hypothetical protein
MARRWKCARCAHENDEALISCGNCGLIRGAAFTGGPVAASPWAAAASEPAPSQAPASEGPPTAAADFEAPSIQGPASDLHPGPVDSEPPSAVPPVQWDDPAALTAEDAAAQKPRPLWRRIPATAIVWIVLIGAGAIGGLIFNASRGASGEINKGGDLTAADLRVGDCFDLKDPSAEEIDKVKAVPCGQEHEYEMFFTGALPAGDYPSDATFDNYVETNCLPAFEAYLGTSYQTSEYDIFWLVPNADGWRGGDHSIQCAAFHPRIHRLTESVKNSKK